jgi:hypothetical protein
MNEINVKRLKVCDESTCLAGDPCDAGVEEIKNCVWVEPTCCEQAMRLKDYSTDGDGLIYICEKCQHEISMNEIMRAAIERIDGETWKMQGRPRDYSRLGF